MRSWLPPSAEQTERDCDCAIWADTEIGFSMSAIAFGRQLVERGFEKVHVDRARGIRGLRLGSDFFAKMTEASRGGR